MSSQGYFKVSWGLVSPIFTLMMVPRLVGGSPLIRFIIKYRFYEWDKSSDT